MVSERDFDKVTDLAYISFFKTQCENSNDVAPVQ